MDRVCNITDYGYLLFGFSEPGTRIVSRGLFVYGTPVRNDVLSLAEFDHLEIHGCNSAGHTLEHGQIMGDNESGELELLLQVCEKAEYLCRTLSS